MKKLWIFTIMLIVVSSVLMAGDEYHLNYIFGSEPVEGHTEGDDWYYELNDKADFGEIPYLWINNLVFGCYLWENTVLPQIGSIYGNNNFFFDQKQYRYGTYSNVGGLSGYVTGEITGYNTGTVSPDSLLFKNNCFNFNGGNTAGLTGNFIDYCIPYNQKNYNGGGIYPEQPGFFEDQYFHGEQIYNNWLSGAYIPFF